MILVSLSSCRQDNATPIRNVRINPKVVNQMQIADPAASSNGFGNIYNGAILVAFDAKLSGTEQRDLVASYGQFKALGQPTLSNGSVVYALELKEGYNAGQVEAIIAELKKDVAISHASPLILASENGRTELRSVYNEVIEKL
ncbi:hypothetical protein [Pontibacter sp. SGAir0037]|uniref:hypothetical protein n=1 Tax=Pontibacter sp. SGAir0037 TaxID=2571030 RepID=UPI0010CD02B9|nr:hypothetical protein [Pontibacter sp. SGAir0037]QCR21414.1 hypothetical protein C1N53_02980 [Pontibacter sp. SGAir0037]